jgi:subtilisin family serine protease
MGFRFRFRLTAPLLVVVLLSSAAGGIALAAGSSHHRLFRGKRPTLSAAQVRRLSTNVTKRSIIIFKNQLTSLPARGKTAHARANVAAVEQAAIRSQLAQVHATHVRSFQIINAISATISQAEVARLQLNPLVRAVVPDSFQRSAPLNGGPGPALGAGVKAGRSAHAESSGAQQVCPSNPAQPLIEPEARTVMNVNAADQIVDGTGIKVGIIADGIDPNNPDLIRANGQHVIFDYQDFSGFGPTAPTDGRESFLDAGTIASQANQTYDLSGFVNPAHPLPAGCNIKIEGVAPGASLAVLNVQGSAAGFFNSQLIQAIQWAVVHDHVNILNESFGGDPLPNTQDDPVALADQAAVAAGVTVVASSGDEGPFNNIGSPATTPGVIGVGGTTTYQVYRQTTRYGTQLSPGGWENNNISALSSDGITEFGPSTVDVVAPGDRGWSLCSKNTKEFQGCADLDKGAAPPPIWAAGGTSASSPETSGTAALVMQAYANSHAGAMPTPALVEHIIVSTADDLGAPADHQGAGLVNTLKAVQLAESINGGSSPQGNTLELSQTKLSTTVDAGQTAGFNVGVTNEGTGPQTVTPTIFGLPITKSNTTGSVSLSPTSPSYIDGEGNKDSYQLRTFTVPAGADYLNGNITWTAASTGGAVFETLFDPAGQVAAYSLIGTDQSGFGHVEVRKPDPGTWTAVIFTINNAAVYKGPVQFSYSTENFPTTGSVSPTSATLAPGQSASFHVSVTAGDAGDESFRLHLGTGAGDDGSLPIVVRSLVPLSSSGGGFNGNLSGGGSPGNAGQSFTYQFRVPNGEPSLNAALVLGDDNYGVEGLLVDPNGEPLDVQSTAAFDADDNLLGFGRTMQFFHNHPQPGVWTLTLLSQLPVPGTHLSVPYRGAISFAGSRVSSTGVPNSASRVLPSGQPVTATVRITNTGNIRKDYFVDPRLNASVPQLLLGSDLSNVALPLSTSVVPTWIVPPGTSEFDVGALGNVPITMDTSAANGDPDVLGVSAGDAALTRLDAPEVAPGFWNATPDATGPFGAGGVGAGAKVNLAALAVANAFDTTVTSSSGDAWQQTVNGDAPYSPLSLAPGQSGTITVTFTPSSHAGTVHGFLGVDTIDPFTVSGDEVSQIPYSYQVG